MVHIRTADDNELALWRTDFQTRIERWYGGLGGVEIGARRLSDWDGASDRELAVLTDESHRIGHVAVARHESPTPAKCMIHDIWLDPARRGHGLGRTARAYAESWARSRTGIGGATVWTEDPAARALFTPYSLRSQRMIKALALAPGLPDGVTVRPMEEFEFADWAANEVVGYAADMADSGSRSPADARAAAEASYAELLPNGPATPLHSIWMVDADGRNVASIWLSHERPNLAYVYSVEVRPEHRGRGYGRAAMLAGEEKALANGHPYLALNVFGHNTVAMGLYDSLGYRVVEQTRTTDTGHLRV